MANSLRSGNPLIKSWEHKTETYVDEIHHPGSLFL